LQDFRAVGINRHHHPRRELYRPHLTDSDRELTHRNRRFSGSFALHLTLAVGAVGILASFPDGLSSLSVYPSAGATPMHLASDYIHPYKDAGGRPAHCRVRIYLPDDMRDAPVVCLLGVTSQLSWLKSLLMVDEENDANVFRSTQSPLKRCIL
jgi:hypothetical protein